MTGDERRDLLQTMTVPVRTRWDRKGHTQELGDCRCWLVVWELLTIKFTAGIHQDRDGVEEYFECLYYLRLSGGRYFYEGKYLTNIIKKG